MACLHDHSCEEHDCSLDWSLYKHIDLSKEFFQLERFTTWESPLALSVANDIEELGTLTERTMVLHRLVLDLTPIVCGSLFSAWSSTILYITLPSYQVSALNEAVPGSVKSVFKAWEMRLNSSEGHLESNEGDPELIVFIPFTSDVKIKSISVVGGADGTSPSKMRAFINRDGIDFSDAHSMQSVQEWELAENLQGVLEYQTRYSRFQGVGNLTLHFPENYGGETTQIHYIGLKGEATQLKRDVVATIVYEITPNPLDHKTKAETGGGFSHVE